jgi:putative membrane protein
MTTYCRILAALTVSLSLPLITANAADETKAKKADQAKSEQAGGKLASDDISFLKTAAAGGMAEVKLGELAQEKGSTAEIKEFGKMMVTDHGKANEELKTLASSRGVELPAELDNKHQATHDKLAKLSGAEFDKAYATEMAKAHKKAVSEFEKASKRAKDSEVRAFAERNLPGLRHHHEAAQSLSGEKAAVKKAA